MLKKKIGIFTIGILVVVLVFVVIFVGTKNSRNEKQTNETSTKHTSERSDDSSKEWYLCKETLSYYSSSEQQWEMGYTKKYLFDRQLLEMEQDLEVMYGDSLFGKSILRNIYDENGRLIAEENDENRTSQFVYIKKGNLYIGEKQSQTDGISYYEKKTYNENNQLVSVATYENDTLQSSSEYVYYDNGSIKEINEFGMFGDCLYQYDERGNLLYYESINNNEITKQIYEYDNNILKEVKWYQGDILTAHEIYDNRDGNVSDATYYDENNSIIGYIRCTYDDYDNLIEQIYYDTDKQPYRRYEYVWEDRGNIKEIINQTTDKSNEGEFTVSTVAVQYAKSYYVADYEGIRECLPYDVDAMFGDMFCTMYEKDGMSLEEAYEDLERDLDIQINGPDDLLSQYCDGYARMIRDEQVSVDVEVLDARKLQDDEIRDAFERNNQRYLEWDVELRDYVKEDEIHEAYEVLLFFAYNEEGDVYRDNLTYTVVKYKGKWKVLTIFDPNMY